MKVKISQNVSVPKVKEAILSPNKIVILYGWRDGGKSTSTARILILLCVFSKKFRCAHIRQHYNEVSSTTFQTLIDQIKALGLQDYFTATKDGFKIIYKNDPEKFFFGASGDLPDKIRSTPEVTHVWWEEMHDCTEKTFASVLGTIREKKDSEQKTKFIGLFNNDKVTDGSFIDKHIFKSNNIKAHIELISHLNNPFIDQHETREKLVMVCMGDVEKYNRLTAGEFVKELPKSPFAYHFKQEHINECTYTKGERVWCVFDFNNAPFCFIFCQIINKGSSVVLNVLDEVKITEGSTIEAIEWIKNSPIWSPLIPYFIISGDQTGSAGNAAYKGNKNHFTSICNELRLPMGFVNLSKNPLHSKSRDDVNYILYHSDYFKVNINPRCTGLIYDLKYVEYDEQKRKIKKENRNNENEQADLLDCFRYFIQNAVSKTGIIKVHQLKK